MSSVTKPSKLTLYSSPISDASARVRIALGLKGIPYELISISLMKHMNEQEPLASLNPAKAVPALLVQRPDSQDVVLTQSNAVLEYLDEAYPHAPNFLPPLENLKARAQARALAGIFATDIHPYTVHRCAREALRQFPCEASKTAAASGNTTWDSHWIRNGFAVYDKMASQTAGKFSVGDEVSTADIYLLPEVWTGMKIGVAMGEYPTMWRVYQNLMGIEVVSKEEHRPDLEGM